MLLPKPGAAVSPVTSISLQATGEGGRNPSGVCVPSHLHGNADTKWFEKALIETYAFAILDRVLIEKRLPPGGGEKG